MISRNFLYAIALLSITKNVSAFPASSTRTEAFHDVRQTIDEAVATYGASQTLVVFDTDNTILATDQDLGSEHWFLWQAAMIKAGDFTHGAVAKTISEALRLQGYILNMTSMHPTEARISQDVAELTQAGVRFTVLTSRMLDVREPTAREYDRAGIDLAANAPGPAHGFAGSYIPYDPARPEAFGLTRDDVVRFGLNSPQPVHYENGIFLTQGQHKGVMLKTLLAKAGLVVKAIVFVDDRSHHLDGVQQAFGTRPEAVYTVQYEHEREHVEAFHVQDKVKVINQWCTLARGLLAITPVDACTSN